MNAARSARLKKEFLKRFRVGGNITAACNEIGLERRRIYDWQEIDDQFAAAFREADIQATEILEIEARRRAVDGVTTETPIYAHGELVDTAIETKYSDTLLIFLLKARAPEKYRERHDVTTGGQPLQSANADIDAAIARRLAQLVPGSEGAASLETVRSPESTDS